MALETTVREVLVKEFKVDPDKIATEVTFDDLGLDSLDVVSFVMALEDRLGIEIPEGDLNGVRTYGDAVALLTSKSA